MPCCIVPVGGGIDQETQGVVQTTEREIQVGLILVAVTVVVAEMMMILAAVVVAVLVPLPFLLLVDIAVALVVVRTGGRERHVLRMGGSQSPRCVQVVVLVIRLIPAPIVIGRLVHYDNR